MAVPLNHMPLAGSALATPSAPCRGPLPPLGQLDVVVRLRPRINAEDVAAVVRFAVDQGLQILDVDPRAAVVDLRGSVLAVSRAFGVQLRSYDGPAGPFRGRRGLVHVPVDLAGVIVAVDGLDERPPVPERSAGHRGGRRVRRDAPRPATRPFPRSSPPSLSVSAAPRAGAGRARAEAAGAAPPASRGVAGGGRDHPAPGGRDAAGTTAGLAVVLPIPVRPVSAPPVHGTGTDGSTVTLAMARTHRRGPLVRAAAEQRDRRLARQLHPAGVDRP